MKEKNRDKYSKFKVHSRLLEWNIIIVWEAIIHKVHI
jgi:hypothetical protein